MATSTDCNRCISVFGGRRDWRHKIDSCIVEFDPVAANFIPTLSVLLRSQQSIAEPHEVAAPACARELIHRSLRSLI